MRRFLYASLVAIGALSLTAAVNGPALAFPATQAPVSMPTPEAYGDGPGHLGARLPLSRHLGAAMGLASSRAGMSQLAWPAVSAEALQSAMAVQSTETSQSAVAARPTLSLPEASVEPTRQPRQFNIRKREPPIVALFLSPGCGTIVRAAFDSGQVLAAARPSTGRRRPPGEGAMYSREDGRR